MRWNFVFVAMELLEPTLNPNRSLENGVSTISNDRLGLKNGLASQMKPTLILCLSEIYREAMHLDAKY